MQRRLYKSNGILDASRLFQAVLRRGEGRFSIERLLSPLPLCYGIGIGHMPVFKIVATRCSLLNPLPASSTLWTAYHLPEPAGTSTTAVLPPDEPSLISVNFGNSRNISAASLVPPSPT